MTICNPSLPTKAIPTCVEFIEVGDVTPNTAVAVYLKDISTGLLIVFQETSNATGRVIVDISNYDFTDKHAYDLWITPANQPIEDYMDITVSGSIASTQFVQVKFMPVIEGDSMFNMSIITLQAE